MGLAQKPRRHPSSWRRSCFPPAWSAPIIIVGCPNFYFRGTSESQQTESQTGTRISVAAEAADAYMQIRGAQARLIFAKDQIATDKHLVELVQQRRDAGVASDRELAQAQALLSQAQATIPLIAVSLEAQLNRLDVVMGAQPGTYAAELTPVVDIPEVPGTLKGDAFAVSTVLWTGAHGAAALLITSQNFPFGDRRLYAEEVVESLLCGVQNRSIERI